MTTTTLRGRLVMGRVTVALVTLVALGGPPPALAAGVVGTGTAGSCTDAALNTALAGGGLVTFNCGPGAVTIDISPGAGGAGTKTISTATTIEGGGRVAISGGNSVQVFVASASLSVRNLSITDGVASQGGAIRTNSVLVVSNSTFSRNLSNAGGAIHSAGGAGPVTITGSTFIENMAVLGSFGGAIFNTSGGTMVIANSTFVGNTAAGGGAIDNEAGAVTIANSTFFDNSATSGGAIRGFTITVVNTIFANNPTGNCNTITLSDGGHNIDDGSSCGFAGPGCSNAIGTSLCNTNPMLDPVGLQLQGGLTETIALLPGSPAINNGDSGVCASAPVDAVDQRSLPRFPLGDPNCDIGAFELQPPSSAPAVSHVGVVGLIVLLGTVGWLALQRPVRRYR